MAILTKRYVIIIGTIASVAIAGLGVNYAVLPSIGSIQEAQTNIQDAESSRDMMQTRLTGLETAKDQFESIQAINSDLALQFPETGQTQLLLDQLFIGAALSGMSTNQIKSIDFSPPTIQTPEIPVAAAPTETAPPAEGEATPSPADTATPPAADAQTALPEGFATLEFSLSLEGSPQQIQAYLNYLNSLQRVVTIREATISQASDDGGLYTLALSATTYVYRAIPLPTETPVETPTQEETTPQG